MFTLHSWLCRAGRHMRRPASLTAILLLLLAYTLPVHAQQVVEPAPEIGPQFSYPAPQLAHSPTNYPADPPDNIPWSASYDDLDDMVLAFNDARARENALLNVFVQPMITPSAATWRTLSDGEKALWLVNDERRARGLAPLQGLETNVNSVAQAYAEWLLANDKFAHDADGRTPEDRLNSRPAIAICHDFLGVAENLYVQGTTSADGVPMVVEQAIYWWMYLDKDWQWGHRHAILWTPYTENSGAPDREGYLGFGHARGSYTMPGSGMTLPYTDMIVMNVFDPCATWVESTPAPVPSPATPEPIETPTPPPLTHRATGMTSAPAWETVVEQPFEKSTWPGGWLAVDTNGATDGDYHWIAANCNVFAGDFSGMAVGGGDDGMALGCDANYPNNARSWITYGPFDLDDAIGAVLEAKVWVDTEANYDMLCLLASVDNRQYDGVCVSGNSRGWVDEQLDLSDVFRVGNLLGRSNLYVGFAFVSDESHTRPGGGAYVDNITLRKNVMTPGAPLYGVEIRSEDGHTTFTDQAGNFSLAGLSPGVHTLTPYRAGYAFYPASVEVDLSAGDQVGISFIGMPRVMLSMRPFATHLPLIRPD